MRFTAVFIPTYLVEYLEPRSGCMEGSVPRHVESIEKSIRQQLLKKQVALCTKEAADKPIVKILPRFLSHGKYSKKLQICMDTDRSLEFE